MIKDNVIGFKINSNTLKIIAMLTMVIDHIGGIIFEIGVLHFPEKAVFMNIISTPLGEIFYNITYILRLIGRISFPIFCFLIVQGFLNTRSVRKYLFRVGIFALISEIPFDLAVSNRFVDFGYQNVLFTFFIGLIMLIFLDKFYKKYILQGLVISISCVFAYFFNTDYSYIGILFIAVFYLFRDDKVLMMLFAVILCIYESSGFYYSAALSLIPMSLYNSEKGRLNLKYFFYWFYPLHMLVLTLVRTFLCNVPLG